MVFITKSYQDLFGVRSYINAEKIRVCYLISLMKEQLPEQDKDKWKEAILKHLDIDEDYYKSKYREPVSDLPSIPNQKFAKEMDGIFR